jgi:hypothetical protein
MLASCKTTEEASTLRAYDASETSIMLNATEKRSSLILIEKVRSFYNKNEPHLKTVEPKTLFFDLVRMNNAIKFLERQTKDDDIINCNTLYGAEQFLIDSLRQTDSSSNLKRNVKSEMAVLKEDFYNGAFNTGCDDTMATGRKTNKYLSEKDLKDAQKARFEISDSIYRLEDVIKKNEMKGGIKIAHLTKRSLRLALPPLDNIINIREKNDSRVSEYFKKACRVLINIELNKVGISQYDFTDKEEALRTYDRLIKIKPVICKR